MNISILETRLLSGHRTTRAFCDLRIGDITIRDFRVCQTNGKPSIRNPFTSYKDFDGNLKFRQIVDLPPNVKAEVDALILSEYFRRLKEQTHEHRSQ